MLIIQRGMQVAITNYGGTRSLGFPTARANSPTSSSDSTRWTLPAQESLFRRLIGRLRKPHRPGKFTLDPRQDRLAQNDKGNHLHGGTRGFDKDVWKVQAPSTKRNRASCSATSARTARKAIPATSRQRSRTRLPTRTNCGSTTTPRPTSHGGQLTNHSYFNLAGAGKRRHPGPPIDVQRRPIHARGQGADSHGRTTAVAGTPFDFTTPTAIGAGSISDDEQLKSAAGYDHNWVLEQEAAENGRWPQRVASRPAAASWRSSPPSRASSSTPATSSTAATSAKGRQGLQAPLRFLPGDAALSRLAQQAGLPQHGAAAGREYRTTTVYRFSASRMPATGPLRTPDTSTWRLAPRRPLRSFRITKPSKRSTMAQTARQRRSQPRGVR